MDDLPRRPVPGPRRMGLLPLASAEAFPAVRFVVLEPEAFERTSFSGRLYSHRTALWKLNWFLRDFGYDMELLGQDQWTKERSGQPSRYRPDSHIKLSWPDLSES